MAFFTEVEKTILEFEWKEPQKIPEQKQWVIRTKPERAHFLIFNYIQSYSDLNSIGVGTKTDTLANWTDRKPRNKPTYI